MRTVAYLFAVLGIAVAAILGAGFVTRAPAASAGGTHLQVTERDFRISVPKQVSSGDLLLRVVNKGPDAHELIVARTSAARLPLRSDGLTIDEAALGPVTEPSLDPGAPGAVRWLRLHLPPGHYVLFCNMAGHFMGGMHSDLVVR